MAVVHRTYARALYDAARERDRVAAVREELAEFVQAMHDVPELRAGSYRVDASVRGRLERLRQQLVRT